MGEQRGRPFQLSFNTSLKIDLHLDLGTLQTKIASQPREQATSVRNRASSKSTTKP